MNRNETAKVIRDLLRIAKVAMPPKLYAEDPRVIVATAALSELEAGVSPARPPNLTSRPPKFDPLALSRTRPIEQSAAGISFLTDLPWDLVSAMTAAQGDVLPLDPSDAVAYVLWDWLTGHGYLDPAPEEPH